MSTPSLFCQLMRGPDAVDEPDDLEWCSPDDDVSCDAEGSSCDDMDVDAAELDAESLESFEGNSSDEDEDIPFTSGHINLFVTLCCQEAGTDAWTIKSVNYTYGWSSITTYVSQRVAPTAYQLYRLIKNDFSTHLPVEFDDGFRIYLTNDDFFEHDGKGPAEGTGPLKGFDTHALATVLQQRAAAQRFYSPELKAKRKVWNAAFLRDLDSHPMVELDVHVVITPLGVHLPRTLSITCGKHTLYGVSPLFSLVNCHQHQKSIEAKQLWMPEHTASFTARTPLVALGWTV